jgi:hypothetical protein
MNINRVCFAGNLTAEPEVNYTPKGTAVVSASITNNEFYGCAGAGVGRISYASCEFTVSIVGIVTAITTTKIVITTKANPTEQLPLRPLVDSTCMFEQMPVSELAVMVQGWRQLQSAGRA